MPNSERAALHLTSDPIISTSTNECLARMVRNVHEKCFKAGETIYHAHDNASILYLIESGTVELVTPEGKHLLIDGTRFGEETATDVPCYLSDAIALTDVVTFTVSRYSLAGLSRFNLECKAEFYFSLLANFGGEEVRRASEGQSEHVKVKDRSWFEAAGWLLAILLPLAIMVFAGDFGASREVRTFLAIFSAAIVMWVFELVDEFVPGLFAVLMTLALGLAPPKVVLGGFASDGFFMAMSILGLGTVIVLSGLGFRCLLWLLRYLPSTKTGHNVGLLLTGLMINPVIPSINARTVLIAPFLIDMVETVKFKFRGKAATQLAISAFTGTTLASACFLTSRSINFVIYGMLSLQEQQHFSWVYWLYAASISCVVMLTLYFVAMSLMFRSPEKSLLSKQQVVVQLNMLGKITSRAWAALAGITVFSLGIVTTSIHNIQPPWMGMAILYTLLLFGYLNKKEFRERTDWPGLIYLGTLIGAIGTFNYLGMDTFLTSNLSILSDVMRSSFSLFLAILFCVIFVIRLVFPNTATIAICATIFMPLASQVGVNPWVIGFTLLLLGDMWVFPYQCPHYQQFQAIVREKNVYDEGSFLKFNMIMNFVRLAGVYAALPFWGALGLL
ncbi:MAG: anion permease [Gallionellaceae bacterium]